MGNLQSTPSSSTTTTVQKKYDVFLNFRGEDTRNCFTCHLYEALHKKIETFIDDGLEKGDGIWPTLKGAIEQSKISVVIFSKDYASSKWCLRELVKIMERKNMHNQIVIPVFYCVNPSNVRKQTGSFKNSFDKHGKESQEEVQKWREALTEASNLSGWDSSVTRPDTTLVDQIVKDILKKLMGECTSHDYGALIGHKRIEEVLSLLCLHVPNVQIIGIWGMGGIGKTTIADAIFNEKSNQFEGVCFIQNVRERLQNSGGLVSLRKEILSQVLEDEHLKVDSPTIPSIIKERLNRKMVLIVLDDVGDYLPLENLARGVDRLGQGSRIIITSRDKQVLQLCGVNDQNIYEVEGFNNHDALQLFCNCAFHENYPPKGRKVLSNQLVNYSKGNPLALKVLGSSLYQASEQEWESVVNTLRTKNLNRRIFDVLKISYDGLEESEKNTFLDIVCFFKWERRDYVEKIIGDCSMELGALIKKSLITIDSGCIQMHDLLEEMGREIVDEESRNKPGKRSRLWRQEEVQNILKYDEGTSAVQGIVLNLSNIKDMQLSSQAFKKMYYLRFLRFYDSGYSNGPYNSKVHFPNDLSDLSSKLRSLVWFGFPSTALPSNFNPKNLVKLDLRASNLERLWEGKMPTPNLKLLTLRGCKCLTNIPDLSYAPLLERIDLKHCRSLLNFPPLAPHLKYLHFLNLRGCTSLRSFQSDIHFESITSLVLRDFANLTKFPEMSGNLRSLDLSGTAIDEVPPSIGSLTKLSDLNLSKCTRLKHISTNICKLKSLRKLNLEYCSALESLPEISGDLESLDLRGSGIYEVPPSIGNLTKLSDLNLSKCTRLKYISTNICKLKSLHKLNLESCSALESFPEIRETMEGLRILQLSGTAIKELPHSIENLNGLNDLWLKRCKNLEELPSSICNLTSLGCFNLSDCSKLEILPDNLGNLKSLYDLSIDRTAISQLPSTMMHLNELHILKCHGCRGLRFTHSSVFPCSLSCLYLVDCNLKEIPEDICHLSSLVRLKLSGNNFESLPKSMKQLSKLKDLYVNNCNMLQSLTELPVSIGTLSASGCKQLRSIPDTSEFAVKAVFIFTNCPNLEETAVGNILETVERYEGELDGLRSFSFCCPGREVPGWFSYKSNESSIKLRMAWHDCSNGLLPGFILCAVIEFEAWQGSELFIRCRWTFSDGDESDLLSDEFSRILLLDYASRIDSDHVALFYHKPLPLQWVLKSEFTNCSFEFRLSMDSHSCRVKSCGVRPITKIPKIKISGVTIEDIGETSGKRSRTSNDHREEEVEPHLKITIPDEDSDEDSDEVYEKHIKMSSLIERSKKLEEWIAASLMEIEDELKISRTLNEN